MSDTEIDPDAEIQPAPRPAPRVVRKKDFRKIVIEPPPERKKRDQNLRTFRPTMTQRVMVAGMVACKVHPSGIASYIHVSDETLRKYFRFEIEQGYDRTEAGLVAVMLAKAFSGNMQALGMLMKCVFGWKENGKPDAPTIDALSNEQRASFIDALRKSIDVEEARTGTRGKKQAHLVAPSGSTDSSD